jgi:hypothetical protein
MYPASYLAAPPCAENDVSTSRLGGLVLIKPAAQITRV